MTTTPELRRFLIIFNPVKNRRRQRVLARLLKTMKLRKLHWQLYPTEAGLAVNQHYFNNHLHEFTDLIVLGGDGTFNQVINCLNAKPSIRVGLLPAGTGNDFARKWYAGANFKDQIEAVLGDHVRPISLGACELLDKDLQVHSTRYFHNSLGTGFDSAIAKKLASRKALFQSFSYLAAALRYIPFYREPSMSIELKGQTINYKNFVTVFANSHYFGGGLPIAPMASAEQSNLEVIWAKKGSLVAKLEILIRVVLGRHMTSALITHQSLAETGLATIKSDSLDLQADGEYIGTSPCNVRVADFKLMLKSASR